MIKEDIVLVLLVGVVGKGVLAVAAVETDLDLVVGEGVVVVDGGEVGVVERAVGVGLVVAAEEGGGALDAAARVFGARRGAAVLAGWGFNLNYREGV